MESGKTSCRARARGQVHAAASDTGLLAFAEGGDLSIGRPVWMDRSGNVEELSLPAAQYNVFHLGPGDRKLALQVGSAVEVWVCEAGTHSGVVAHCGSPSALVPEQLARSDE